MASPFGKASSPFADKCGGSNNGLRRFMPKNPFQPHDGGTPQTKEGSSFLGNASTSPFSFGISSSFERTGNQEKQESMFQPSTPFRGEILVSGTMAHGLNILGNASTSSFSTGKASPFAFSSNEHKEKNPFQRLKAVGCEGIASRNSQITKGSLIFGHGSSSPFSFGNSSPFASTSNDQESKNPFKQSTSPFSFGNSSPFASTSNEQELKNPFKQSTSPFGNSSPFASTSNDQESKNPFKQSTSPFSSGNSSPFASITNDQELQKNPFKQSTFLIGKSLGSGTSQTMEGSSIQGNASTRSFSFGKSSPFSISSNVHKPEPKNPFQNLTRDGNRSTWSQKEMGNSIIGGGSPIIAPFGRPASYQDPLPPFASGSGSQSTGPSSSFRPLRDSNPADFGNTFTTPWTFLPSGYGNLPWVENAECMDEETLISLSATPLYENTSAEELRWADYQAKKAAASQMTFKVAPSGPFIVSSMCNGASSPSNSQIFTSNPADSSTPICKFCNNGGSLAPSLAMSSAGSIKGTQSPYTSFNPLSQATPASSPALPFSGLQLGSPSPFGSSSTAFGLFSGLSSITTMSCPPQASSDARGDVRGQLGKASCLEWPQSSLQSPVLSMPSPLTTIASSPSADSIDQNISPESWALAPAAPANSYAVTSGMSFTFSNAESSSLMQHGISSLPDDDKYAQPRTISLLPSKLVFQKTVIRMQSRRQGSLKKDGPRVSFLNDYSDPEDSEKVDALFVARQNPKEFLLHTRLNNNIGALKDDSIKAM